MGTLIVMDIDSVTQYLDIALVKQLGRHLRPPELTVLRGTWDRLTYEEIAQTSTYSLNYLKRDVGPKFWKALTDSFGEEVNKSNIRGVLARRHDFNPLIPTKTLPLARSEGAPVLDWRNAPSPVDLVGRQKEISILKEWILNDQSALVIVQGMVGMGKTALIRQLAEDIKGKYKYVSWHSITRKPTLKHLVSDFLEVMHTEISKQDIINVAVQALQASHCLLVLDGFEAIFESGQLAGKYGLGYEDYSDFLHAIGETQHQSCVLLTTREQLFSLNTLLWKGSHVRMLQLEGVPTSDLHALLNSQGILEQSDCNSLSHMYQGNPAALGIVTHWIKTVFGGNVAQFLSHQTGLLRDIEDLLSPCFAKLTTLEQSILYRLALAEHALSFHDLAEQKDDNSHQTELLNAIVSLKARSFLRSDTNTQELSFSLPSLVETYTLLQLKSQVNGHLPQLSMDRSQSMSWLQDSQSITKFDEELTLSPVQVTPLHLSQWFQGHIEPKWQPLDVLWQNPADLLPRLRSMSHLRDQGAIKRVKRLQFEDEFTVHTLDLLVMVTSKVDQRFRIQVQLQHAKTNQCLPANLVLSLLNDTGDCLSEIKAHSHDEYIRLPAFSGKVAEGFKILMSLNQYEMIEDFIL